MYTIGHSTRTLEDFVALLHARRITQLADVRTVPMSRRYPHFAGESLAQSLPADGVTYRHFRRLGGLRKPRADSRNTAWRNESFRGYADYMETEDFERELTELMAWSAGGPTAIMCAEAVWWRCHRQLIADALVARGLEVRHILGPATAATHALTVFARVDAARRVTYPGLL